MVKTIKQDNVVVRRARAGDNVAIAELLDQLGYQNTTDFAWRKIMQLSGTKNTRKILCRVKQR